MTMWDGRFGKQPDKLMHEFNSSLPVDKALIEEDIAGSIAWAQALQKVRVLSAAESRKIVAGLKAILASWRRRKLVLRADDEDIHMAVERILTERIGSVGAKLHTGRSRNDQVATDFRMFVRKALLLVHGDVYKLQKVLLSRAQRDQKVICAGYTHLQQAQPICLSQYWLSMFFALEREKNRLHNALGAADIMPLGSGALAGSGFAVDRRALATKLGFAAVCDNSMDGVASRDFVLDALAAFSSIAILLSRYSEDLIIWSSREFGYIELDDAWSTGSSMMPQKKNPDSLELIRGKAGRFVGNYTRFAATLKGVGLTYYKDLQEDKERLLDSYVQARQVLSVFAEVVRTLKVNAGRMASALDSFLFATDLADYLVRKKVPFRKAHHIVGRIVGQCARQKRALTDLTLTELKAFSPLFGRDALGVLNAEKALQARNVAGGTGMRSIAAQLRTARALLGES